MYIDLFIYLIILTEVLVIHHLHYSTQEAETIPLTKIIDIV